MKSSIAVLVLALGACATAGGGGGGDDDVGDDDGTLTPDARSPDASEIVPIDAEVPDAGPTAVTLSQSTSTTVTPDNSTACGSAGSTSENSYYRVFPLSQLGVDGQFTATSVVFGIETSTAHSVDVKLHTLSGNMRLGGLTLLRTQAVSVPAVTAGTPQNLTVTLTTPVVVPAGSTLVVEVHSVPPSGGRFFMGSNAAGETATGWTYAPPCGDTDVITMTAAGAPNMHIVLTVSGTTP
jgi:hypothetical protein